MDSLKAQTRFTWVLDCTTTELVIRVDWLGDLANYKEGLMLDEG